MTIIPFLIPFYTFMTNCLLSPSIVFKMHMHKISLIPNYVLLGEGRRRKGNQNAKEIVATPTS